MRSSTYLAPRLVLVSLAALIVLSARGLTVSPAQSQQTPTPQPTPAKPILLTDPVPDPNQEGVRWFAATGHTLRGAFLDYWTRYGGLEQFGYPLTEEFYEPVGADNKQYLVQYFERNRFELHPEIKGTQYEVLLGALGMEFRKADPPSPPLPEPASYFPQTGHNLSGKFLEYWHSHGGLFVHGYPITEAVMERSTDGKEHLVQWFERSRFELHPENAGSEYEVLLGLLGRQLSEKKGFPYGWYPRFGYAPDFSWVAGEAHVYYPNAYCREIGCGCALFLVDGHHLYLQMVIADDPSFPVHGLRPEGSDTKVPPYVFFGRRANAGESYIPCTLAQDVCGYLVKRVQNNPSR